MAPFVGEIRLFAGSFAPLGWLYCDGQLLPIAENETLFQLIGTTYGGDGQTTFALPDLRSRVPVHQGGGLVLAETGGAESVTLSDSPRTTMAPQSVAPTGGSQPHENMQPFLCVGFIISLFGIFPSPT